MTAAVPTYHRMHTGISVELPPYYTTRAWADRRHPAFSKLRPRAEKRFPLQPPALPTKLPVVQETLSPQQIDALTVGGGRARACSCLRYRCAELEYVRPDGKQRHWCGYYGRPIHIDGNNPKRDRECFRERGK